MKQIDYKYYRLNIQPKNIMVRLSIGGHNYYGRATNTKEAEKQAALKALKTRFL